MNRPSGEKSIFFGYTQFNERNTFGGPPLADTNAIWLMLSLRKKSVRMCFPSGDQLHG